MQGYDYFFQDLFVFNASFVGLTLIASYLTKKYGMVHWITIVSLLLLYSMLFSHFLFNPYFGIVFFNIPFIMAPIIIVKIYYDRRIMYMFIAFVFTVTQISYFVLSDFRLNTFLVVAYLGISLLVILLPSTKQRWLDACILYAASFGITVLCVALSNVFEIRLLTVEMIIWFLNFFTLLWISHYIVPELLRYVENTFTEAELERDSLTGAYNRYSLKKHLEAITIQHLNHAKFPFSILFLDINLFKQINDDYGHLVGDIYLKTFVEKIQGNIRQEDQLFRYGGDEFIIFTKLTDDELNHLLMRLEKEVQGQTFSTDNHILTLHYSIGVASYPKDGSLVQEIVKIADQRMYKNKRKNRGLSYHEKQNVSETSND
ncbi:GGDEF domain-containing protein [Paenisporosarcina cavernae]|uniref:Diguanylate cyclase n=1 Tax=Paenisporosarcina cavernae TaxID=2320858 RepID=A0A385YQ50_9BACL|nr:GGDEF domain-containing protein [Paenisporosarcina cavernae]AYC28581.1 diguanylate cyclase [Paenisporosarcina cavernae]